MTAQTPRITANDLARYMVSSQTTQLSIIRRAKNPTLPPIIRYRDVRVPICEYLSDPTRNVNPLIKAEMALEQRSQDSSQSAMRQDDAKKSIEVLHAIQRLSNQLGEFDFQPAPTKQQNLLLSGVDVSVKADLLVHAANRNKALIGAAILRMTQDDTDSESSREKRREMGLYVATLVRMHVDQNIASDRALSNHLCMSIDVQHGEIFHAPNAAVRRMSDLESACLMISVLWPKL